MNIRRLIRELPILGPLSRLIVPPKAIYHFDDQQEFDSSGQYWERRYREGGSSGAGSYNRLAQFKADVLNNLIKKHGITSIIEFGCGDGAQLETSRLAIPYVGVDVSKTILRSCMKRFSGMPHYQFRHSSEAAGLRADAAISLDVIYHLVEDQTFDEYMTSLFDAAERFVIIYASNHDAQAESQHVRHREFTAWIQENRPSARLAEHIPNRYPFDPTDPDHTSFADFYVFALSF